MSASRVVWLKVQGVVRAVDYTREGELWSKAAERMYNRMIVPHEAERFILESWPLPFGGLDGIDRYRVRMAWRPAPGGPAIPDPDIEVLTGPRRTPVPMRPEHQHRRHYTW